MDVSEKLASHMLSCFDLKPQVFLQDISRTNFEFELECC